MRPLSSAARAAAVAAFGAGAAGCPTSMWMTWPPEASIRAAAAITSITMKGGTSLRAEAVNRRLAESVPSVRPPVARPLARPLARFLNVASGIDICYLARRFIHPAPQTGRIQRLGRAYIVSAPPPTIKDRSMLLRLATGIRVPKLTALVTAIACALAPLPGFAQEQAVKGPNIIRDAEAEQLLRDYVRPILGVAGLQKQNIQVVIINDKVFNAFVADGHRIFVNYGAILQSETPNQLIGVLAHETGHLAGGHLAKMRQQLANAQTQLIIATVLGVGAIAAGARSGADNGLTSAGAAVLSAPQSVIQRS